MEIKFIIKILVLLWIHTFYNLFQAVIVTAVGRSVEEDILYHPVEITDMLNRPVDERADAGLTTFQCGLLYESYKVLAASKV